MASEPDGADFTDPEIADLTDAELVGRYRSVQAEVTRLWQARLGEDAEAMRPVFERMLANMQFFPGLGPEAQPWLEQGWKLRQEMGRRMGEMLGGTRLALGLSRRDLAKVAGIHSKFVDEIEQGRRGWPSDPGLFEGACTEGGLRPADCSRSFSLWAPLADPRLCRTIREVEVDPAWLSGVEGSVATLVRSIRESRNFDLLPILGDALEEAGCADLEILGHCRNPGEHARGCWVVEALVRAGRPGGRPRDP